MADQTTTVSEAIDRAYQEQNKPEETQETPEETKETQETEETSEDESAKETETETEDKETETEEVLDLDLGDLNAEQAKAAIQLYQNLLDPNKTKATAERIAKSAGLTVEQREAIKKETEKEQSILDILTEELKSDTPLEDLSYMAPKLAKALEKVIDYSVNRPLATKAQAEEQKKVDAAWNSLKSRRSEATTKEAEVVNFIQKYPPPTDRQVDWDEYFSVVEKAVLGPPPAEKKTSGSEVKRAAKIKKNAGKPKVSASEVDESNLKPGSSKLPSIEEAVNAAAKGVSLS